MNLVFKTGNIIEEDTDGLVCSGNVQLNMSGGVNGALLLAGGEHMQKFLHNHLATSHKKYVDPGFVILLPVTGTSFRSIVYTVAVDCFYNSSIDLVTRCLKNALALLAEDQCETVSVCALGTGYGHLSKKDFGRALRQCLDSLAYPFAEMRIVLSMDLDRDEVISGYGFD